MSTGRRPQPSVEGRKLSPFVKAILAAVVIGGWILMTVLYAMGGGG